MCIASTAKRRRRQAAIGYTHLPKKRRPHYSKISESKSARREAAKVAKEKSMRQKKK